MPQKPLFTQDIINQKRLEIYLSKCRTQLINDYVDNKLEADRVKYPNEKFFQFLLGDNYREKEVQALWQECLDGIDINKALGDMMEQEEIKERYGNIF